MGIFTSWIFWVVVGIGFGVPILYALITKAIRKSGKDPDAWRKKRTGSKSAQHVRDVVRKYDDKHEK